MLAFLLFVAVSNASKGIDVSQSTSTSSFSCLRTNGFTSIVIVRAWRSSGTFDTNCVQTLKNAASAGFTAKTSDVYFFPCVSCGDAAGQVKTFWSKVESNSLKVERVWFDIEGTWTSSTTSFNRNFFDAMINEARAIGIKYGIYASKNGWTSILGSYTFKYASDIPLWYAHYDNKASFSDWSSYGGWSAPTMKQYLGDVATCSANVDYNYKA
ncbi:lysozyme, putative [Entamoeba invadens IP1]|uniref:lysozyme n=1 Tax=Entamoeba invadens IP1 TaxID=370355 RepID=A0A0A1U3E2_ENTIV|nr:lysozyme, putative [Entamoeba invadens IP1]ELP88659.1 lysozyme, putative [Entamoeba invadens IP1]|eukprot:XP_004255430.1 lysozyme, putative [Entamoeba invadens IP1]